jgi:hypothetical protein
MHAAQQLVCQLQETAIGCLAAQRIQHRLRYGVFCPVTAAQRPSPDRFISPAPAFPKSVGLPEGSADFVPVSFLYFFIALRLLSENAALVFLTGCVTTRFPDGPLSFP